MNTVQRLSLSGVVIAISVSVVSLLTFVGPRSQGPLSSMLTHLGTVVSSLEHRLVRAVREPARSRELNWFDPYRRDPVWLKMPDGVLLGAYDDQLPESLEGIVTVEAALGTTLPLIHFYTAWGDKPDQQFPQRLVQAIADLGSVPVITWEPWLTDFERTLHAHLPPREARDQGGLAAIAAGAYDFYIDAWARDAARSGVPIYLRFGHEMNDPYRYPWGPQNNEPEAFIAAWKHVVSRFEGAGADKVVWVWSPHLAYGSYEAFYPGDDYVDWVATGVLNFGTVAYWSKWWSFQEIFGDKYERLAALGKPIMIAELGSLAVGGDREVWFREALTDLPDRHPQVKAVLFFHSSKDATVTYQTLDWSFTRDSTLAQTIVEAMAPWVRPHDR